MVARFAAAHRVVATSIAASAAAQALQGFASNPDVEL